MSLFTPAELRMLAISDAAEIESPLVRAGVFKRPRGAPPERKRVGGKYVSERKKP